MLKTGYALEKAFDWEKAKLAVIEFVKDNKSEKAAALTAEVQ